jgi:hypothetical protein
LDPVADQSLKAQLLSKLGLGQSAIVEAMQGNCGGLNEGVWVIQDAASHSVLVLKLVKTRQSYLTNNCRRE